MEGNADFARLELLFKRTGSLPSLPSTAVQLLKSIDSGEASAGSLEKIIAADPSLSAEFLRMASVAAAGGAPKYSTIRGAIMLLGQRTVRSLAVSLLLRSMMQTRTVTPYFDSSRFSRHSLGVAMVARYLFARRSARGDMVSNWSADEVFASGLLSSLGIGLLPRVSAESFDRIYFYAKRAGITLEEAFQTIFGQSSTLLTACAVEAWGLPHLFAIALINLYQPWAHQEEFSSICCLNYAVNICDSKGLSVGDWQPTIQLLPEVALEVNIPPEEEQALMETIPRHVQEWMDSSKRVA